MSNLTHYIDVKFLVIKKFFQLNSSQIYLSTTQYYKRTLVMVYNINKLHIKPMKSEFKNPRGAS